MLKARVFVKCCNIWSKNIFNACNCLFKHKIEEWRLITRPNWERIYGTSSTHCAKCTKLFDSVKIHKWVDFKLTKHVCYITKHFQFDHNILTATSEWVQLEIWNHANKLKKKNRPQCSTPCKPRHKINNEEIKNASYCNFHFFCEKVIRTQFDL